MRFFFFYSLGRRHIPTESDLISKHELGQLLDEQMTEKEQEDLEEAEAICRRFLQWNLEDEGERDGVKDRLRVVLGREAEETDV